jgi:hypothetical protein
MTKLVRVQIGPNGLPIRIFRDKSWRYLPEDEVQIMDRANAVGAIRAQVFDRSETEDGNNNECENCGRYITWKSFEMHESLPKGSGGEVSVENCEALCHKCHTGSPDSAHGNRRWQTAKLSPEG